MKRFGLPPSIRSDSLSRRVLSSNGVMTMGDASVQPLGSMSSHTRKGPFVHFFVNRSSYNSFSMITFVQASAIAPSVPGRRCSW